MTPLQHNIFLNRIGQLPIEHRLAGALQIVCWLLDNGYMVRNFDQPKKAGYKPTIKGRLYLHKLRRSLEC